MSDINYKYDEPKLIKEFHDYINKTYGQHYAQGEQDVQTLQLIGKEPDRGFHYCQGNILKYADRCLHKNQTRSDLLKVLHYGLLALNHFDRMEQQKDA